MKNDNTKKFGTAVTKKKADSRKIATIVIAALTLLTLIAGITVGVITTRDVDYLKDDLSKYIYISESDYKSYPVKVSFDDITDSDVEREIMYLLTKNRDESPAHSGAYVKETITLGDEVYLYYRGYTVDENGKETDIDGACNITSEDPYALTVGSLSFVPGFEEGLLGITPDKFYTLEKHGAGKVNPTDVIYLSCKVLLPDGKTAQYKSKRIDLGLGEALDEIYGEGFYAFFTQGKKSYDASYAERVVGEKITDLDENGKMQEEFLFQIGGEGTALYYDMKIDYATRTEDSCVTIDVYFPKDYKTEQLRGVNAKFDVYVHYLISYNTPEFDDAFVTDTLKISESDLAEHEGDTLTDKCRAKIKADLIAAREEDRKTLIEDAMWEQYKKCAEVKKYPEREVKTYYNNLCQELEAAYVNYSSYYSSVDEFACAYYSLDSLDDWRAHVRSVAEEAVKEKLVFYYVVRAENLIPSDEDYERIFNESFDAYLTYYKENMYKTDLLNCKTDKERENLIEKIKKDIMDYYGEQYFEEEVIYTYALEKLLDFAAIEED